MKYIFFNEIESFVFIEINLHSVKQMFNYINEKDILYKIFFNVYFYHLLKRNFLKLLSLNFKIRIS